MKILVTGVSGLIGRWVWRCLAKQGHEVIGLDRAKPPEEFREQSFYICDILDAERVNFVLTQSQPEMLIHLAARVDLDEKHNLNGYATNIDGVRNVLNAVRHSPSIRRAIYTSSQLVCRVGYVPESMDEYCPNTLYGESKVMTERLVKEMDGGGVEWSLVRPTTVWGPEMNLHYQRMLKLINRGLFFHCGNAKLYKSYSYAGNIAHQYFRILTAPASAVHRRTFYLADYEPLSLRDYTNDLAKELGARAIPTLPLALTRLLAFCGDVIGAVPGLSFPFNSFRLNNILTEYIMNLKATESVCGQLPFSYKEGVVKTAEWYKSLAREKGI